MKVIAALFCVLAAHAADDDPVALLARVRDKVMAHAVRVPNHTCVETIVRDWYDAAAGTPPRSCDALLGRRKRAGEGTLVRLSTTDRLRLDVGIAGGDEIYSWAGAGKFEEKELNEIVPPGAIATGPFAATILGLFEIRDPNFAFEGETTQDGRLMMEYSFSVSQDESHSRVKAGTVWLTTGYTGTLLVDPANAEIVRVRIRTAELPRATNLCEVDSTMEYGLVQLGEQEYLLPKLTRERFITQDGSEAENTITFSACREFRGESAVSFGGGPRPRSEGGPASEEPGLKLPAGLAVSIDMTSPLNSETAAGDEIEGRLAAPVVDEKKRTLLPAGAIARGRLLRVETLHGKTGSTSIVLRWETLEAGGVNMALSLTPNRQVEGQKIPVRGQLQQRPLHFVLPRPGEEQYVEFKFPGEQLVVNAPLRTEWFTALR